MMSSKSLTGFYKLDLEDRQRSLSDACDIPRNDITLLTSTDFSLPQSVADEMIENCIGRYTLPLGVATNFTVDGREIVVPFACEEPSVVAAASSAAKLASKNGGFKTRAGKNLASGQSVFTITEELDDEQVEQLIEKLSSLRSKIRECINSNLESMVRRGGGCANDEQITPCLVETESGLMLTIEFSVDVCDAQGANVMSFAAEKLCRFLPPLITNVKLEPLIGIVSNLPSFRLVTSTFEIDIMDIRPSGCACVDYEESQCIARKIIAANSFAKACPSRAATHRKGIMNGISSVALAMGNDTRALEAGVHSYACNSNNPALTNYKIEGNKFIGEITIPITIGIVGGSMQRNRNFITLKKMMKVKNVNDFASVLASVGLAQNFSAIKALVTTGITPVHMPLHSQNIAAAAGVENKEQRKRIASQLCSRSQGGFPATVTVAQNLIYTKCNT